MGLITDEAVKAATKAIQPLIEAAKKDAVKAASGASQQAVDGLKQRFANDIGTVNTALQKAAQLAEGNTQAAKAAQDKADANEQAVKKLTDEAQKTQHAATDLQNALQKATQDLGEADKKLGEMKAHDEAVGRVLKAMSMWLDSGKDLDEFGKELIKKGAKQEDIDLFKIKK